MLFSWENKKLRTTKANLRKTREGIPPLRPLFSSGFPKFPTQKRSVCAGARVSACVGF